jgi:hypothetical protein
MKETKTIRPVLSRSEKEFMTPDEDSFHNMVCEFRNPGEESIKYADIQMIEAGRYTGVQNTGICLPFPLVLQESGTW